MTNDIGKILITADRIDARVKELADQINADFAGEEVIFVGILRGSCYFLCDLTRRIKESSYIEFMSVSSYKGTQSSGEVRINTDISMPIEGKNVIIVEDIIDTGTTLAYLKRIMLERRPKSLKICSLLDKPSRRKVSIEGDYVGFTVPDEFVVGYGLDYNQRYRNFPHIGVLKPEIYEN
ncbi:MAG: hypoxanthine phosphoribosyltransferase [Christensenellales bacterium]